MAFCGLSLYRGPQKTSFHVHLLLGGAAALVNSKHSFRRKRTGGQGGRGRKRIGPRGGGLRHIRLSGGGVGLDPQTQMRQCRGGGLEPQARTCPAGLLGEEGRCWGEGGGGPFIGTCCLLQRVLFLCSSTVSCSLLCSFDDLALKRAVLGLPACKRNPCFIFFQDSFSQKYKNVGVSRYGEPRNSEKPFGNYFGHDPSLSPHDPKNMF
jgi:hypothetical protein